MNKKGSIFRVQLYSENQTTYPANLLCILSAEILAKKINWNYVFPQLVEENYIK